MYQYFNFGLKVDDKSCISVHCEDVKLSPSEGKLGVWNTNMLRLLILDKPMNLTENVVCGLLEDCPSEVSIMILSGPASHNFYCYVSHDGGSPGV